MNELHLESSPYLLQHAQNPVHWRAWKKQALTDAQKLNKLLIISSGYAACHWCHVMEHECFENEEVAHVMNTHFVCIKVDREEHPDVDAVYMKALQIMTKQGGWPLNVVSLPDGRPIWGGTYVSKNNWIEALLELVRIFNENPLQIKEYAEKLHQGLHAVSTLMPANQIKVTALSQDINSLIDKWKRSFDTEYGGYAKAPKFMLPNNFKFLLRYGIENNDEQLINQVFLTLDRMAWGGIFDVVGGGFSRYATDTRWHIPHFEKMLYDNGQLVSLYADAYKLTGKNLYLEIIEKTLQFVESDLSSTEGGFYCALDADSMNASHQLEEGAYYCWQKDELKMLLGPDFNLFALVFNVADFGHWEEEKFVLIQNKPLEQIAALHHYELPALIQRKKEWELILLNHRKNRSKPRLDNKQLTAWNAIMLSGYIDAYKATGKADYLIRAQKNAAFINAYLWTSEGNLIRNYSPGNALKGYLEDYAFTIEAFINLYTVTFDSSWLKSAKQLVDYCLDVFFDTQTGFFWHTEKGGDLITPFYEIEDNVIPAANSVMAKNLRKLSVYFNHLHYEHIAMQMVAKITSEIDYPSAFSNWLEVLLDFGKNAFEVVFSGPQAQKMALKFQLEYRPGALIAGSNIPSDIPLLRERFVEDKTLFYVCRNKSCGLPNDNFQNLLKATLPNDNNTNTFH